jgi:hypothetical protein
MDKGKEGEKEMKDVDWKRIFLSPSKIYFHI